MPRIALDSLRGRPVPEALGFRERAVVRFLDERVIDTAEVERAGQDLLGSLA